MKHRQRFSSFICISSFDAVWSLFLLENGKNCSSHFSRAQPLDWKNGKIHVWAQISREKVVLESRERISTLVRDWSRTRLFRRHIDSRAKIAVGETRWKRRACRRWRTPAVIETRRRNEVRTCSRWHVPRPITILWFFRLRVWSPSGFRSLARSAPLYLMSSFPSFFQPSTDGFPSRFPDRRSVIFALFAWNDANSRHLTYQRVVCCTNCCANKERLLW